MKLEVGVQGTKRSKRFLRALWAALRREFGKCVWQFSPRRFGPARTIRFGFADLGLKGGTLEIGCSYTQRGDVDAVYFVWPLRMAEIDPTCDLGQRLKIATAEALEAMDSPQRFNLAAEVNISTPAGVSLYPYHDTAFTIVPSSDHEFVIFLQIDGYDEYDAKQECFSRINGMVDFLAVATNGSFHVLTDPCVYVPSEHRRQLPDTVYWLDHDWMDDFPLKNDHLCLREADKTFLNFIALADLNNKSEIFLKTAHLFHMAGKHDYVGISFLKTFAESRVEIATVLYVSALEVASLIDAPAPVHCDTCGQPIYTISKRVRDLASGYGGQGIADLIDDYYHMRSRYLHVGSLLATPGYRGMMRPQLDPDSDRTGCQDVLAVPLKNLREFTSYCLRQMLDDFLTH